MRIGIVGNGVVGSATANAFKYFGHEVLIYDKLKGRSTHDPIDVLTKSDLVFICLPETELDWWFSRVHRSIRDASFVLKSTVPIGTTKRLAKECGLTNLVHSPEFLSEKTAKEDALNPTRLIVGGRDDHKVIKLYLECWPDIGVMLMTSDESEAVKLFQNAFSAIKISTFNEFRRLADKLGMGWGSIMGGLMAGGWINKMHSEVPGHDGKRGWGGKCYGKDLMMLIEDMKMALDWKEVSLAAPICAAAMMRNEMIDRAK